MRIALVHPYAWPEVRRGAERYLDDLAVYLAGRGHEVLVVTGTDGRACTERRPDGARVRSLPHLAPVRAARLGLGPVETFGTRALPTLMRSGADVVHAFTPAAALAGWLSGRPTLFTVAGHPDPSQLPRQVVPRRLLAAATRRATVVAALSESSASAVQATLGREAVVLPPGVRPEAFHPDLSPRTGPPRILLSAALDDRRKRVDLAVRALAHVLRRRPDARLVLSGEGDPAWALAGAPPEVLTALDVCGPGRPEDVPERYRASSVTVLPAGHEAFGLALVESLASGTPVVCTPGGGMAEIVGAAGDGVGRVATAATPAELAGAVLDTLELAADNETPARCVARARAWDWQRAVGPRHEVLYRELVEREVGREVGRGAGSGAVPDASGRDLERSRS